MNRPCKNCPFLRTHTFMLRPGRKREIADTLRDGAEFPCHQTLDYNIDVDEGDESDDRKDSRRTDKTTFCAGALLTMENGGGSGAYANQMARLSDRLRLIDIEKLTGHELCFNGLREWERQSDETPAEKPKTKRKGKK